jgi:hypothetical protein
MFRIVRSCYVLVARPRIDANEILTFEIYSTYFERKTAIGGQFGWGGTLLKRYQQGPMVSSTGSEIRCRVQEQKLA